MHKVPSSHFPHYRRADYVEKLNDAKENVAFAGVMGSAGSVVCGVISALYAPSTYTTIASVYRYWDLPDVSHDLEIVVATAWLGSLIACIQLGRKSLQWSDRARRITNVTKRIKETPPNL